MKKFLASLLALLLLAMPFAALAESAPAMDLSAFMTEEDYYTRALQAGRPVSFTITVSDVATDLTGEPAIDQVIAEVLNAAVISGYTQGNEQSFSLGMTQQNGSVSDLLSFTTAVNEKDTYFKSNLTGGAIVVGEDELLPFMERLIDVMTQVGFFDEETAAGLKAELPAMMEQVKAELAAADSAQIDYASLDFSALTEAFAVVAGKMEMGAPDILPRNCDPAVAMVTVTMTPDEMKGMIAAAIKFIQDNPTLADYIAAQISFEESIAPSMAGVTDETPTFTEFLGMASAELENEQLYAADTVIRIWLGADNMPVAGQLTSATFSEAGEVVEFTVNYNRLTMNDAVAHSCTLIMPNGGMTLNIVDKGADFTANFSVVTEKGDMPLEMNIEYTDRSAENLEACTAVVDIAVVSDADDLDVDAAQVTTKIKLDIVSDTVFTGDDFDENSAVTITVDGKQIMTIHVNRATSEAVQSIMDEDVVRPATMSDAEFAQWFVDVYATLYAWPQKLIYSLPASVINLMTTAY